MLEQVVDQVQDPTPPKLLQRINGRCFQKKHTHAELLLNKPQLAIAAAEKARIGGTAQSDNPLQDAIRSGMRAGTLLFRSKAFNHWVRVTKSEQHRYLEDLL